MIQFDYDKRIYTCPFCKRQQAINGSSFVENATGFGTRLGANLADKELLKTDLIVFSVRCSNLECRKVTVLAMNRHLRKRICDIIPKIVIRQFPEYIPQQIRQDYEEATRILNDSPKAAATLYRRCLQGMIRED